VLTGIGGLPKIILGNLRCGPGVSTAALLYTTNLSPGSTAQSRITSATRFAAEEDAEPSYSTKALGAEPTVEAGWGNRVGSEEERYSWAS